MSDLPAELEEGRDRRSARPPLETLLRRAMKLRCPRCGIGKLFIGWFTMPDRCAECGLTFERAPGYFLGSAYINYGLTALLLTTMYMGLHFGVGWTNRQLAVPLAAFCIAFPLATFRWARAIWLALDAHIDASVLEEGPSEVDGSGRSDDL